MSRSRESVRPAPAAEVHAVSSSSGLSRDLDLGLRMVEGLVRIGEVGSAIRLTEELRMEAAEALTPAAAPRARRAPRGATVIAGVAVALGVGLSAAAFVGTNPGPDSAERPAQVERHVEPAFAEGDGLGPAESEAGVPLGADGSPRTAEVAPSVEAEGEVPSDERRRVPRIDAPEDIPEPFEPPPMPLIIPLPDLPIG